MPKVAVYTRSTTGGSRRYVKATRDASMQQYGFSTITVSGLVLDTSRVRRKPEAPEQEADNGAPLRSC
jgi:hypothetical protein